MPVLQKGRYAPPVHMIKLTEAQEITPYKWGASRRGEVSSRLFLFGTPRNELNLGPVGFCHGKRGG
jgi:hypothetical protein